MTALSRSQCRQGPARPDRADARARRSRWSPTPARRSSPIPATSWSATPAPPGIAVVTIPGPSAVIAALTLAGLPTDRFAFFGFLPAKAAAPGRGDRRGRGVQGHAGLLRKRPAPRRHASPRLRDGLGDREAAVAREISKRFEETVTGTLVRARRALCRRAAQGRDRDRRRPARRGARRPSEAEIDAALREAMARLSPSRAAAEVAAAARPAEARRLRAGAAAQMKRQRAERGGRRAERLAAWWLRLKGWRILAVRARTPVGEVDLVARRGRILAFIEVKARATEAEAALGARRISPAPRRRAPPRRSRRATPATATTSGSTRCSSSPRRWPRHLRQCLARVTAPAPLA